MATCHDLLRLHNWGLHSSTACSPTFLKRPSNRRGSAVHRRMCFSYCRRNTEKLLKISVSPIPRIRAGRAAVSFSCGQKRRIVFSASFKSNVRLSSLRFPSNRPTEILAADSPRFNRSLVKLGVRRASHHHL